MIAAFYGMLGLVLILFQTVIRPFFFPNASYFDVLIPFVVFMGLFRPIREGLVVIPLLGIFMDGLSGGPFFLFTTVFFWVYLASKWLINFLHAHSWLVLPFLLAMAVLCENLVLTGVGGLIDSSRSITQYDLQRIAQQTLWSAATGPFWVWGMARGCRKWCRWNERFKDRNGF